MIRDAPVRAEHRDNGGLPQPRGVFGQQAVDLGGPDGLRVLIRVGGMHGADPLGDLDQRHVECLDGLAHLLGKDGRKMTGVSLGFCDRVGAQLPDRETCGKQGGANDGHRNANEVA
jgi:hypothetical protein